MDALQGGRQVNAKPAVEEDFERQWRSTLHLFRAMLGEEPERYKLLVFDAYAQGRVDQACEDATRGGKR